MVHLQGHSTHRLLRLLRASLCNVPYRSSLANAIHHLPTPVSVHLLVQHALCVFPRLVARFTDRLVEIESSRVQEFKISRPGPVCATDCGGLHDLPKLVKTVVAARARCVADGSRRRARYGVGCVKNCAAPSRLSAAPRREPRVQRHLRSLGRLIVRHSMGYAFRSPVQEGDATRDIL